MSDTSVVINNIANKFGNGADRIMSDIEKLSTEFLKRVDVIAPQMASEIKRIGLYAWQCLVRQQIAEGIFYILAGIAIPVLMYLYFKLVMKPYCSIKHNPYDDFSTFLIVIGVVSTIASIIMTGCFLFYGITHIISPEYYAIEELILKLNTQQQPKR